MKQSIVEQGAFGVRQTALWLKAYKRASKFVARSFPTVKASKRCLQQLEDACKPFTESA
ncbi:hypothetical protein GCM10027082_24090 [Comamonas humi]